MFALLITYWTEEGLHTVGAKPAVATLFSAGVHSQGKSLKGVLSERRDSKLVPNGQRKM